jgi:predicted nucleic acid-binding protein
MIEAAVVDASVAIKWVIGEAGAEAAAKLAGSQLSAPDILLAECGERAMSEGASWRDHR